jgi:hypothetical protein
MTDIATWYEREAEFHRPFVSPEEWTDVAESPQRTLGPGQGRDAVADMMMAVRELVAVQETYLHGVRLVHVQKPTPPRVPPVEERFAALAEGWRRETLIESSPTRMALHKAYQQIIGLGPPAVPLILRELEREPTYWFWALTSITGEDPAAGEDTLQGATERWLEWGRQHGFLA